MGWGELEVLGVLVWTIFLQEVNAWLVDVAGVPPCGVEEPAVLKVSDAAEVGAVKVDPVPFGGRDDGVAEIHSGEAAGIEAEIAEIERDEWDPWLTQKQRLP